MVKVSITLPNAAQITLESEESEIIQQVVSMALRDLPRELMQASAGPVSDSGQADRPTDSRGVTGRASPGPNLNVVQEAGIGQVEIVGPETAGSLPEIGAAEPQEAANSGLASGPAAATPGRARASRSAAPPPARTPADSVTGEYENAVSGGIQSATRTQIITTEAEQQFAQFCAAAAPLGDMRKVVVAAEGAERYLGMASVDATNLARLFGLAGWRTPHNFIQTLRNAARDKYRWLERVPGRSGRYSSTELGRSVTITR